MPDSREEYRFIIDAYSPDTIPMARLAEYMGELATLLGEPHAVHFVRLENGSTALVHAVEHEAVPKIRARVQCVKHQEGPADAQRAYDALNRRLSDDNATGRLVESGGANVIEFPGRERLLEQVYGPFSQSGHLVGIVILVGGESDPVPVHLDDGGRVLNCRAKRTLAKELARHLFDAPVRVEGLGRWVREADGRWALRNFSISSFEELEDQPLQTVVGRLQAVGGRWKGNPDAIADLGKIRRGDEGE